MDLLLFATMRQSKYFILVVTTKDVTGLQSGPPRTNIVALYARFVEM